MGNPRLWDALDTEVFLTEVNLKYFAAFVLQY